jgi:hypothetical protein
MENIPQPLPQGSVHLAPMHYNNPIHVSNKSQNIETFSEQIPSTSSKPINFVTAAFPFYYSDAYYTPSYNSYYLQGNLVSYPHIGKESDKFTYGTAGGETRIFTNGRGYGPGERTGGFSGNFGGGFGGVGMGGIKFGNK